MDRERIGVFLQIIPAFNARFKTLQLAYQKERGF